MPLKVGCCLLTIALISAGGSIAGAAEGGRSTPGVFRPNANPAATPAPNRAIIGGRVMIRPGSGLSRLGGPAKPVGAINGSAIAGKH